MRAITARFCIPAGGRAARELILALPSALCCDGLRPTEFDTFAPLNAAGERRAPPGLMGSPFTNALREAVVTAFTLRAFTKLMLRMFVLLKTFTFRMNVLWMLIMLMKLRLQGKKGKKGSPNPNGNHPTPKPKPNPKSKPPPRKPTKAGPKTGGPKNGPGHQPQAPPMNDQRP